MRKRLLSAGFGFLAGVLLSTPVAFAEQPSQDRDVWALRQAFRAARVPTYRDLALGRYWDCVYRSASPGNGSVVETLANYRFVLASAGRLQLQGGDEGDRLWFARNSLRGERYWRGELHALVYMRIGSKGELLIEYTLPECSTYQCLFRWVQDGGVENPWAPLLAYEVCTRSRSP